MFKLPKGIKVGHADNGKTGITVIMCEKGCIGGCDVRGGAPGTRETALLSPTKMMDEVHAVVLSGGSAYGLEGACGVMDYLRERKIGYKVDASKVVPIVPAAVLYDLNDKSYSYPDKQMGYEACKNATTTPEFGRVGAGTGATVGKIRGIKHCSRGGIGAATVKIFGIRVTAIVAVNAFGDVCDEDGNILAGAKGSKGFINTEKTILEGSLLKLLLGTNTTIGCIITDAKLDKAGANKLASVGHNGYAKAIRPVHTDYDGDTLFCLATGKKKVVNFAFLQVAAIEAVRLAVINAVTHKGSSEPELINNKEDTLALDKANKEILDVTAGKNKAETALNQAGKDLIFNKTNNDFPALDKASKELIESEPHLNKSLISKDGAEYDPQLLSMLLKESGLIDNNADDEED